MPIFVRTDQGLQAAYATASALPRKLRSILKLIDGKTELSIFEQNLQSFGDVKSIFYTLAGAGFIKALPDGAQDFKVAMHRTDAELQPLMQPAHAPEWMATRSFYAEQSPSVPALADSGLDTQNFQLSDLQTSLTDTKKTAALKDVTDDMSGFVLTHLPDQAFFLLKEIEAITSMEMLAVMLGGYTQMVSHLGHASDIHLASIRQVLRDNM